MDEKEDSEKLETATLVRCLKCRRLLTRTVIRENEGKCPYCGDHSFRLEWK